MDELAQRYIGHMAEAEIESVSPEPLCWYTSKPLKFFKAIPVLSEEEILQPQREANPKYQHPHLSDF